MIFRGVGGVGGNFAISQWILEIGVGGASILGGSILGINNGCVGVEGGV